LIGLFLVAPIYLFVIFALSSSKSWILKYEKESGGGIARFSVFMHWLIDSICIMFQFWRTWWIFKIETDNKGISYFGLPKQISASWHEIVSINVRKFIIFREMVEVKTRNGIFCFPFSMKEKGKTYPKILFVIGMNWMKWQYEGEELDRLITFENCPLYIEIQKHLDNK
jgi:hypothetical protein